MWRVPGIGDTASGAYQTPTEFIRPLMCTNELCYPSLSGFSYQGGLSSVELHQGSPCEVRVISGAPSWLTILPECTSLGENESEEIVKKSRFIARSSPAPTFEEGKAALSRVLQEHPKARHNCWAWRGLEGNHRFSDDGEPGGTAGQPILGAIEGEGVSEVMVVVTRYFGGIKLGTGGLCRAYSGAARSCLQQAERAMRMPVAQLRVTAPMASLGGVYQAVSGCERLSEDFTADGQVVLRIAVDVEEVDDVKRRLQDATRGAAEVGDDEYAPED